MNDLMEDLARLSTAAGEADDATVAADLRRGRRAQRNRRLTRLVTSGVAVVAVGGLATAVVVGQHDGTAPAEATHRTTHAMQLVDYDGAQLPGFTIDKVPNGFVLQGADGGKLDIARPDNHTTLDSFVGKVVVTLLPTDMKVDTKGTPVTVNGQQGYLVRQDASTSLEYTDGTHEVVVQSWNGIGLTDAQLVELAEGITVTDAVQPTHG